MLVVVDGIAIGQRANLVLEHLLVDPKVRVTIEIVVAGSHLGDCHFRSGRLRCGIGSVHCVHIVILHGDCELTGRHDVIRGKCGAI